MTVARSSSAPGHGVVAHAIVTEAEVTSTPVGRPIALELRLPDGTMRQASGVLYRPRSAPPSGRVCVALWLRDEAVAGVPEETAVWIEDNSDSTARHSAPSNFDDPASDLVVISPA